MRLLLCAAILICLARCQIPDIKNIKLNNERPKASGTGGWEKTRLLFLEYSYRGESVLYDIIENKENAPSTVIEAKYTWETLHHDEGGSILSRLRMIECVSGPCGDVPDVYVDFVQGGNNLNAVYMDLGGDSERQPEWNWLLAIANTVYTPALNGEGDSQMVDSPYGRCRYDFGRPEDKKFRRMIGGCEIGGEYNYTRFGGLQVSKYSQDVWYIQNTKMDADIVIIDAVEELSLRSPLDGRWGFSLESRVHIEMDNRTKLYVDRHCTMETSVVDCALQKFKLTKVGDRKYEGVRMAPPHKNRFGDSVAAYREHLHEMGPAHTCPLHSALFSDLLREALVASEADFVAAIRHPDNEPVLNVVANVMGSVGSTETLKVAREVLFVDAPETVPSYLFGAANAVRNDEKWHKQMMYWLMEEKKSASRDVFWQVANAVATVLRKRCEQTPSSSNACAKGKEKIVSKFISEMGDCKEEECVEEALQALENLPLPETYQYAKKFICTKHSVGVQTAALGVVRATPSRYFDSQLVRQLVNVFRDTCPSESNLKMAQLAVDVLMEAVVEQQNAATLLLRGESLHPSHPERWTYLYRAVRSHRTRDDNKDEIWRRMRAFKVFRPNWGQRALGGQSAAHHGPLEELFGYSTEMASSSLFLEDVYQGSAIDISLRQKKKSYGLFSLDLFASGHDSFLRESEQKTSGSPRGEARLGLLDHKLPKVVLFDGDADLVSAAWNADGQTLTAFEGSASLRAFSSALPLLSGLTVRFDTHGAANVKLLGSCLISLWNRDSLTQIDTNVSVSLAQAASLLSYGSAVRSVEAELSAVSTISSRTDVEFVDFPPSFCLTVGRKETPVRLSVTIEEEDQKKSRKTWTRRLPGETFALERNLLAKCNALANLH